jgi:hypothetical protein
MRIAQILKYSLVGFGLQIIWFVIAIMMPLGMRRSMFTIYDPWLSVGGYLFASSGGGGHAMAGDAIAGLLIGVVFIRCLSESG